MIRLLFGAAFGASKFAHGQGQDSVVTDDMSFITKIMMDAGFGNTLFKDGNKSRNSAIELLVGGNIANHSVKWLSKMTIQEPKTVSNSSPGYKYDIDLRLAPEINWDSGEWSLSSSSPQYIDLEAIQSGTLLVLYHPETNVSTANLTQVNTECDAMADQYDNKIDGCQCVDKNPHGALDPLTGLQTWDFLPCAEDILSKNIPIRHFAISDLDFTDAFNDIVIYGKTQTGQEIEIAKYKFESQEIQNGSRVIRSLATPANAFEPEFHISMGGWFRDGTDPLYTMTSYHAMMTDTQRQAPRDSFVADYRWQPKSTLGRLLNPIAERDGEPKRMVKSGWSSKHQPWNSSSLNLWNSFDTRPLDIHSELIFGRDLNDHRIHWDIRVNWMKGRMIEDLPVDDGVLWQIRKDHASTHDGPDQRFSHMWIPVDPNMAHGESMHIGGVASTVFKSVTPVASDPRACLPLFEFEDGTSYFDQEVIANNGIDPLDWFKIECTTESRKKMDMQRLNPVKPWIPEEIRQPLFNTSYFDTTISSGQFFMSNIGLVDLQSHNVEAVTNDPTDGTKRMVIRSPESHFSLRSYFEFPFLPGHYIATGSISANGEDDPWVKQKENTCTSDKREYKSDLQNFKHLPFDSNEPAPWSNPNSPSEWWSKDPAYGYCDYCAHDECCCHRLNNSANLTEDLYNYGVGWGGSLSDQHKTGWSTSPPMNRAIEPCGWDTSTRTCVRNAQLCSDCNDVGELWSQHSCCLNLSQAPNGPRCVMNEARAVCSDAPLECNACNNLDNSKDCCNVRKDTCTWLPTLDECIDLPEQCADCPSEGCCADIASAMHCSWNSGADQCESIVTECSMCDPTENVDPVTGLVSIWVEGCCTGAGDKCIYTNDQCQNRPSTCTECNALIEGPWSIGGSVTISTQREDCCSYGGLDCSFIDGSCYDKIEQCHECNDLGTGAQDCCGVISNASGCSWESSMGCIPDISINCDFCNALIERDGCCEERPWCVWYTKPVPEGSQASNIGVCKSKPNTCEECNMIPFKEACCELKEGCSMLDTLCHTDGFLYQNKCDKGFDYSGLMMGSAGLAAFGLVAAMITHYLLRDLKIVAQETPAEVQNQAPADNATQIVNEECDNVPEMEFELAEQSAADLLLHPASLKVESSSIPPESIPEDHSDNVTDF